MKLNREQIQEIIKMLPGSRVGTFSYGGYYKDNLILMMEELKDKVAPKRIFEIGTHCGHSSLAFLSMLEPDFVYSIDIGEPWISGEDLLKVRNILQANFLGKFEQTHISSFEHEMLLSKLGSNNFDFAHIDGLHTYDGCSKDIELVKKMGISKMLLDDYTTCEDVRRAVKDSGLKIVKIYDNIHNEADIGTAYCEL